MPAGNFGTLENGNIIAARDATPISNKKYNLCEKVKLKYPEKLLQGRNGREIISSDLGLIFIYLSATIGASGATSIGMVKINSLFYLILFNLAER